MFLYYLINFGLIVNGKSLLPYHSFHDIDGIVFLEVGDYSRILPALGTPQTAADRLVIEVDALHIVGQGFKLILDSSQNRSGVSFICRMIRLPTAVGLSRSR
jgi:hypothetical protein